MKTLIKIFSLAAFSCFSGQAVQAQTTDVRVPGILGGAGKTQVWKVNFDGDTQRFLKVSSNHFNPTIVLRRSDGTILARYHGVRGGAPASCKLFSSTGGMGWVTVIVTGDSHGRFNLDYSERPAPAGTTPIKITAKPPAPKTPSNRAKLDVKIEWTAKVDVDLWVYEPGNPNKIYFGRRKGAGELTPDNTTGGASAFETYKLNAGPAGTYRIVVNLFSDRRTPQEGRGTPVDVTLRIETPQRPYTIPLRLTRVGESSAERPVTLN